MFIMSWAFLLLLFLNQSAGFDLSFPKLCVGILALHLPDGLNADGGIGVPPLAKRADNKNMSTKNWGGGGGGAFQGHAG